MSRKNNKILLLNNRHPYDGVGKYALELFYALRRNVSNVYALSWHNQLFKGSLRSSMIFPYFLVNTLMAFRVPENYSLYHFTNHGLLSLAILRSELRPSVVTVHDVIPFTMPRSTIDLFVKKIMVKSLPKADKIICVSQNTKTELLKVLNIDPQKIEVVYNGVNHNLFKPRDKITARKKLGLPLEKNIVLNVGSAEKRKNIPTLFKAMKILAKDMPSTILIRVGSETRQTKNLIKSLGLSNRIIHFNSITNRNLAYIYNAADLFVFPSYYEGFGLPLLEAMSSGLPVISTNVSVMPEIAGGASILVNPFDIGTLSFWMREVLSDQDLRERLSIKALKRSEMFSWTKCAVDTLKVYEDVLERSF